MRSYTIDPTLARQANANNYIDSTGKYIGAFTRAEAVTSKQKTEGVEFTFKSRDGQTADYLTLWTFNEKGEPLYGLKILNALLTCLRLRDIQPQAGSITNHDGSVRQGQVFPALMNKPIGVLLQREAYVKSDGSDGYKFNIYAPFEAGTELTASEILDKETTPKKLGSIVATLRDRPAQKRQGAAGQQPRSGGGQSSEGGDPFGNMHDDIPY
jgi:hypothetical protein